MTMLRVGLNPYGITYYLGLQGHGTPRANPKGRGLEGFILIGEELGAQTMEIFEPWLAAMDEQALHTLRDRFAAQGVTPIVSSSLTMGPVDRAISIAQKLGAKVVRLGLTSVLCGDRHALGAKWPELVAGVRRALADHAPEAVARGVTLAIENHQDFRSEELVAFCEEAGAGVGICFDTGNTFPVGEAPLEFTRRIAPHVRHVHLKDYRVQGTDEGYRLVRCAIGDGAVPLREMIEILGHYHGELTAVLEPGALDARHVRLLRPEWWQFYPPLSAAELAACFAAARHRRLAEDEAYKTPWELEQDGEVLIAYELDMIHKSAANMRAIGCMRAEGEE